MRITGLVWSEVSDALGEQRIHIVGRLDCDKPFRVRCEKHFGERSRACPNLHNTFTQKRQENVEDPLTIVPGEMHRLKFVTGVIQCKADGYSCCPRGPAGLPAFAPSFSSSAAVAFCVSVGVVGAPRPPPPPMAASSGVRPLLSGAFKSAPLPARNWMTSFHPHVMAPRRADAPPSAPALTFAPAFNNKSR